MRVKILAVAAFMSLALGMMGCHSPAPVLPRAAAAENTTWPRTVDEAVARILADMSAADKEKIRTTQKDDLILFHHGWGTGIRNQFGLWQGNPELMAACHATHPDDASMVIIEAVWRKLQKAGDALPF